MDERLDLDAVRQRAEDRAESLRRALEPGGSDAALSYNPLTWASADDVPALLAEISNLGTALEAAQSDVASLREERDEALAKLNAVRDMRDSHFEAALEISEDRVRLIVERDRLAAQVARVRDELREHVANLGDKQPWENRAMFERALAGLEGE